MKTTKKGLTWVPERRHSNEDEQKWNKRGWDDAEKKIEEISEHLQPTKNNEQEREKNYTVYI